MSAYVIDGKRYTTRKYEVVLGGVGVTDAWSVWHDGEQIGAFFRRGDRMIGPIDIGHTFGNCFRTVREMVAWFAASQKTEEGR